MADINSAPEISEASVDEISSLLTTIAKSQNDSALDVLAKSADDIVQQNKELSERTSNLAAHLEKSIAALTEKLNALQATVLALTPAKSDDNTPVVKSISAAVIEPSPMDVKPQVEQLTKSFVLDAALKELVSTQDSARRIELRGGIARLESNFSPAQVAAELRISR